MSLEIGILNLVANYINLVTLEVSEGWTVEEFPISRGGVTNTRKIVKLILF
ncbi:hypothetical protein QGM71_17930 [Virgibacillus sp. C22-A2]|uniref:Uncharacterized protein n=1 Tax=Virgibacillus tibetensis TaxID=3042313 RepID=A0ABU6KKG5_9BACI|nr:hypothetical protein [Virgibacillus sp. C22-A2]